MTVLDGVVALAAAGIVKVLKPTGTVETVVWAGSVRAVQRLTANAAITVLSERMGIDFLRLLSLVKAVQA